MVFLSLHPSHAHDEAEMTTQAMLWTAAGCAGSVAVFATGAEWLRNRRKRLDRVGWMPWQTLSVIAFFAALGLAALALHN
jgi:hypothetical protein